MDIEGRTVQLGLKLSHKEFLTSLGGKWEFQVEKDLGLPARASVLKAAHLTMFHLLGYRYALSAGGLFLGKTVLGDIFLKTQGMERSWTLDIAEDHFRQFSSMVRPFVALSPDFCGTLTDRLVHFFMRGQQVWACQVVVRTGDQRYAAIVPFLEDADSAALFHSFLESPSRKVEVTVGRLNHDEIQMSPTEQTIEWPET